MARIFIAYRRDDAQAVAGRIYERLQTAFGESNVYKDLDDIPPGSDFRDVIRLAIDECDVTLIVIGPGWLHAADADGKRLLESEDDPLRFEIATALHRQDMTVIPLLVNGAGMPLPGDLPDDLKQVAYRNAVVVRDDPDFRRDMDRLVDQLNKLMVGQISGVRALGPDEPEQMAGDPIRLAAAAAGRTPPLPGRAYVILLAVALVAVLIFALINSGSRTTDTTPATATPDPALLGAPYPADWNTGTTLTLATDAHLQAQTQRIDADDPLLPAGTTVRVHTAQVFYAYEPANPLGYPHWWLVQYGETQQVGWLPLDVLLLAEGDQSGESP